VSSLDFLFLFLLPLFLDGEKVDAEGGLLLAAPLGGCVEED
jgi:hypothetical protein